MSGEIPRWTKEDFARNVIYVSDEDWSFLNELLNTEIIKIKYLPGSPHLTINSNGSWIDLYTYEDTVLQPGDFKIISLGIAMKLPDGYEANFVPRSSTFKRWGVLQTNCYSVIDPTYCGDSDIWSYPVYATRAVTIPKGTRLCQFRINRVQPAIRFEEVSTLGDTDRGGFGTSGA